MTLVNDRNVAVVRALAEGLVVAEGDHGEANQDAKRVSELLRLGAIDDDFCRHVLHFLESAAAASGVKKLQIVLPLLDTRLGGLLLGGWPFTSVVPQCFPQLSLAQRQAALRGWYNSGLNDICGLFRGVKAAILLTYYARVAPGASLNPTWPLIGYPGPPNPRPPVSALRRRAEEVINNAVVSLSAAAGKDRRAPDDASIAELRHRLESKGLTVRIPTEEDTALAGAAKPALVVECDAAVTGSGAGGSAAAAVLAAAGRRVVVVEKSTWQPAANLTLQEASSLATMYERGGLMATEDSSVIIMAGSTLGGGPTINWGACWRTPGHVREEWAQRHGCKHFASPVFDAALDDVCKRLGVRTEGFDHSPMDQVLSHGLTSLGVHVGPMPRNCQGKPGDCSAHCVLGCSHGHKRDMLTTYLHDACRDGAVCLTEAYAARIVTAPAGTKGGARGRARMVAGLLVEHRPWPHGALPDSRFSVLLRCKHVYAASGAIHTPALLLQSGIHGRGNVGAHLHLHPAQVVWGQMNEGEADIPYGKDAPLAKAEGPNGRTPHLPSLRDVEDLAIPARCPTPPLGSRVVMWRGAAFSAVSLELAQWDRQPHHGPMVATPIFHPGQIAALVPWTGAAAHKRIMAHADRTALFLLYHRDRSEGRVTVDATGRPCVAYWPNAEDRQDMMRGVEMCLKALVAAGATTVGTLQQMEGSSCDVRSGEEGRQDLREFLSHVRAEGIRPNRSVVGSAHQMGSARMGSDPASSAFDPEGESWDVAGLFVCDTSAFPSATGANPMVTAIATGRMVAQLSLRGGDA